MKNSIHLLIWLFLCFSFFFTSVFARSTVICGNNFNYQTLPPPPPTVNAFQYHCINDVILLTATPTAGGVLNWYGTSATGGIPSPNAPVPSTFSAGTTTYYVSQTVGGEESARASIVINVSKQLGLFCDATKTTLNSVGFDFANVGQTSFTYNYSIAGGPIITGVWSSPSNYVVTGVLPGQSVTFTITAIGAPSCISPSQTVSCHSICTSDLKITPTFLTTPTDYCLNEVVTTLPTVSTNGISGTWSPSKVDTSVMGTSTYIFIPNSISFPCALNTSLLINVAPIVPDFHDFSLCSGDIAPILNPISPNGISGIWSPAVIDNTTTGTYEFTPFAGQSCTPSTKTVRVTVFPNTIITNFNWTVSEVFSKNQILSITNPLGANYLYQLDAGPFQSQPFFEKVASGTHTLTVKEDNGCSILSKNDVLVIGFPKYFTPNGDNFNDYWTIPGLTEISREAIIYIYDRYGKLIKEVSPDTKGWDGTYIGQQMPASDYWFKVVYFEDNVQKEFHSHFSLKR